MYNLLVTSQNGAWDKGSYQYDKSRFLEYTNETIASMFSKHIDNLKSYPCIFAYEGYSSYIRIGRLTSIDKCGDHNIFIKFEFQKDINPTPFNKIKGIANLLDIRDWEMNRTHWAVKDKDLFLILRDNGIISSKPTLKTNKQKIPEIPKSTNPEASKVQEFIKEIFELEKADDRAIFYRGHSNKDKYKLEPSLFRKDEEGNYLYLDQEHTLFQELLVLNSADFQSDVCTLDKLVRMQHYSLPTRLLDIASNPLIALYFACKSLFADDGEVIAFSIDRTNVKYFDSDVASCIANLARLSKSEQDEIDFEVQDDFNNKQTIARLIHFIREEKPFFKPEIKPSDLRKIICVKGKQSNDRISSQSGAFLLFGYDSVFGENITPTISVSRITIKGSNKKLILKELDQLNINESTVFPHIENSAKYVADKYKFKKESFA